MGRANVTTVEDAERPADRPTLSWERVRKAADKLTTPLLPDDYLTLLNPLWSSRELRGRVEEVIRETDDAATLVIRPGWGWRYLHRPGQFVGIVHLPSGPADAIRLYATSPSMPRPGIAPVVGSRTGQVTTFGTIVTLEFGGLLLNTGSQTTTVTLPAGVPILRPTSQGSSDLAVGTQVVATGPIDDDGSLVATAVRVTGGTTSPPPVARSTR